MASLHPGEDVSSLSSSIFRVHLLSNTSLLASINASLVSPGLWQLRVSAGEGGSSLSVMAASEVSFSLSLLLVDSARPLGFSAAEERLQTGVWAEEGEESQAGRAGVCGGVVCACVRACTGICVRACVWCTCMHVCVCECVSECVWGGVVRACVRACVRAYVHVLVYACVHVCG